MRYGLELIDNCFILINSSLARKTLPTIMLAVIIPLAKSRLILAWTRSVAWRINALAFRDLLFSIPLEVERGPDLDLYSWNDSRLNMERKPNLGFPSIQHLRYY
jgi:hypothetical protein